MVQGNYSSDTQDLIRKAQQTMGNVPVLDLTNWQSPRYMSNDSQIKSLAGSCHSIVVKTTVDGNTDKCPILVSSSIVFCTGPTLATCPTVTTGTCPTGGVVSTSQYVNMIAVFTMGASQNGVVVTFKYLVDDVPTQTSVTVNVVLGSNYVYAFLPNNVQYPAGTSLVLYGAEVLV